MLWAPDLSSGDFGAFPLQTKAINPQSWQWGSLHEQDINKKAGESKKEAWIKRETKTLVVLSDVIGTIYFVVMWIFFSDLTTAAMALKSINK